MTGGGTNRQPTVEVSFQIRGPLLDTILPVKLEFTDSFEQTIELARKQVESMATELAELASQPLYP